MLTTVPLIAWSLHQAAAVPLPVGPAARAWVFVGTTAPTSGRRGMGAVLVFMPTRDRTTWCSAMPTGRGKLRSQ